MRKEDPPREELLRTRVIQYAESESTLPQPDGFTSETQGINGCYLLDSTTYTWISEEVERDVGQSETSNRKQRLGLILMSVAIGYNQCKALRPFACIRTGDSVPSQSVATGVVKVHRRILISVLLQAGVIAALAVSNLPRIKQIPPPVGDTPVLGTVCFDPWD